MAKQSGYSSVSKDIQDIANLGLDRDYNVPMVIAYVHNPVTDELDRMEQPGILSPQQVITAPQSLLGLLRLVMI